MDNAFNIRVKLIKIIHSILSSVLHRGEWSASRFSRLSPRGRNPL